MAKLDITEEERERRRLNALELHAQGKLGGVEFGKLGGRPRKKRATEIAAEKIDEKGQQIADRLMQLILESESEKTALDAIKHAHAITEQERKIEVEEEVRYEQLKHNELLAIVVGNLERLTQDGRIQLHDFIDQEPLELEAGTTD
jgi:hypothetical protein